MEVANERGGETVNITTHIRHLLSIQYRLCVQYNGITVPHNIISDDLRQLRKKAKSLSDYQYWSIYKSGPLGLCEREIDCSLWHQN